MKEFQVWWSEDNCAATFAPTENIELLKKNELMEKDAILLHTIHAINYLDACQQYYKLMDHGEYVPARDKDGTLDPIYLEEYE